MTNVYKNSGTGKVIHRGITLEKEIIKSIEEMIFFLNKESSIPAITRIAIAHYYFGYIHPFYDGNGRTSRFISSLYLNKELSLLSAISLSRGCNKHRSKYLEAFEKSNSVINRGEMNYFLDTFLEILISVQGDLIEQLKLKKEQLEFAEKRIHDHPFLQNGSRKLYKSIVYVMAQHHFFDVSGEGMTVQKLAKMYKRSDQHIRKILKELEEHQLLATKGTRPVYYFLNEEFLYQ